jgi:hypothetical protein
MRDHDEAVLGSRRDHYADWARNVDHARPAELESCIEQRMSDAYSIHFHCWQPDTFLDFFVAARERYGLDFEVVALAPPEREDDDEFILLLVKGRFDGVRFPPRYPRSRVQAGVLRSPLGPPLRALRRVAVRMRRRPIRK